MAPTSNGSPAGGVLRQLLEREPLVLALAGSLPGGIFVADVSGRCIYVNNRFRAVCAMPAEAATEAWLSTVHPEDCARVTTEWSSAIADLGAWRSEFRCVRGDGVIRWVAASSAPVHDEGGAAIGHIGAVEDVSTRSRLQQKLSLLLDASRTLLESPRIADVLPATMALAKDVIAADAYAVWRLDPSQGWRIVAATGVSESFANLIIQSYLADAGTAAGLSMPIAIDDVASSAMLAERRAIYAAEGIRSMLVVPLRIGGTLSGTLVFYYRTLQAFDDIRTQSAAALGHLAGGALSAAELYEEQLRQKDHSERARQRATFLAEAGVALGASLDYEATLRTVAQLAVPRIADWCTVDVMDASGKLTRLAVAHVDPAKVELARTFHERYPQNLAAPHSIDEVVASGRPAMMSDISDEMYVAAARDAEHLRALRDLGITSFMSVPLAAGGRTLGAITFAISGGAQRYDEDDLRFAEAVAERAALAVDSAAAYREVRAANNAKDEFLATLSHELRTPINAIMGWAQMLQHRVLDSDRMDNAIDAIVRNAAAQNRLIEDLLDLSRIVAGKFQLDAEPVDLGSVVSAAIATIQPAAMAKGLAVETTIDAAGVRVDGDRQRLQQAVWNLLSNAVKFTPAGGRVDLGILRAGRTVQIVVSDTGEGIRPDVLPFIFDRFRQADSSSTRHHTGLGLGLALVRHIVELHGGTVEAESEGAGRGATFRLTLPVAAAESRR